MAADDAYDVVVATLQEKIDKFEKMCQSNMQNDTVNVMDDIRWSQIEQLKAAQTLWLDNR